jgi:hypothetical protein
MGVASQIAQFFNVPGGVPPPGDFAAADLVLILGPLRDAPRTLELAGALKLALEQGACLVFAYLARFEDLDRRFFADLEPLLVTSNAGGTVTALANEPLPHPAFREYLTLHGHSDLFFSSLPDDAETLGHIRLTANPYETGPAAINVVYENGSLYVVPYHSAGDMWVLLDRLVQSVWEHREGTLAAMPPFFDELRLPGEEKLNQAMTKHRDELQRMDESRTGLTRHKLLVGHGSGTTLEALIIEELNLVLAGSGLEARDVQERGVEDFEVVDEAKNRRAFAESKAASRGVTLEHVNQLNSHRTELFDAAADELPGLLVVNTFRNEDELARRRTAVDDRIVRHAQRMNVLILRTWDLYGLVARRLAGGDDAGVVAAALQGGGGWLEVTEKGLTNHGSE